MGGLTDGLLARPYVEALAAECDSHCWAPVQPILSPSCAGFGCSSLEKNAAELAELLAYLQRSRGATAFDVIGHSTGCQDAVHLLATAPPHLRKLIRAVVLQAPVSDHEAASLEDVLEERHALLAEAQRMIAERYASLVGRSGPDDLFSSDFSSQELIERLAHLSTAGQREARGELATVPVPDQPGLKVL